MEKQLSINTIFCEALGKSGKDPFLTFQPKTSNDYLGGAAAIANNVAVFSNKVEFISMIGEKMEYQNFIKKNLRNKFLSQEDVYITRQRHRTNLEKCIEHLKNFEKKKSIEDFDKAAEDLRLATRALGMIVGNVDVEEIEQIRKEVMKLNPLGVGSKDLKEYLTFQIGDSNIISNKIVENYFDDFLNQDKDKIKQHINCTDKEIDEALSFISDQNFSPILDNDLGIENVLPDAIVKEKEDKWLILINDRLLNKYQISQDYLDAAMNSNSSKEEKTFLKNHISDAQNILDTLNYRSNTLKDVIEQILLVQGNFLRNKSKFLNPLKLEDIANKIDKDISSISRVVKNKYIDTPIGLISLKSLFSNALTKKSGKTASTNELKKVMLEIIDAEDKKSPLSDSDVVDKLNEKDFLIARRTVAKYRKLLDIKNVNQRIEK